ncbi:hypothetical protein AruPA_04310 [Acidiphilium sp. PA]|uniref:hypothetical protein n=1 Tax=Acidiphilium sp. PA TaxID=2871705 RepID=UPI002242FF34|nr:hypothetical protein [Acidiphilium sp. PA]MCW8306251.1 hypothetical protein [Acidiphilium sp. PA]
MMRAPDGSDFNQGAAIAALAGDPAGCGDADGARVRVAHDKGAPGRAAAHRLPHG